MADGIGISVTGATVASGAASANVVIPTLPGGIPTKYYRIAASQAAYVKIGQSGVAAVAGDMVVQPGDAVIVRASGPYVAALQQTAAGVVQISPLDDV